MGQDPEAIRSEIEQTRERMGDTVEAIGYKADVPSRAKEAVSDRLGSVKDVAKSGAGTAQENPLGLAVGAFAAGFLAGILIPSTRVENEKIGAVSDQVKEQVKETGQEALERGKQVAQEVAGQAQETAQQAAKEQGEQLAASAQENAQSVGGSA